MLLQQHRSLERLPWLLVFIVSPLGFRVSDPQINGALLASFRQQSTESVQYYYYYYCCCSVAVPNACRTAAYKYRSSVTQFPTPIHGAGLASRGRCCNLK